MEPWVSTNQLRVERPTSSEGQNLALMHSLPGGQLSRFGEEEEQRVDGRIRRRWSLRNHILLLQYRLFDWEPVAGRARKNGRWAPGAGKMPAGVEILRTLTWNLLSNASRGSGNLGQEYICNTRALTGNQLWLGRSWGSRASLTVIFFS